MVAGSRRRARAYALQVLYALDVNEGSGAAGAADAYRHHFEVEVEGDTLAFAAGLIEQVQSRLAEVDETITSASRNWRVERMSRVDRNVLRLATAELLFSPDVPTKVVINEAVELAKRFGASESAAFVNGVLDRIAHQVR